MLVDRNKLNMGNHEIMRERAKMEEVRFSNKDLQDKSHPWACFSNYYIREFIVQGIYYPTVEHYFSSQKFTTPEYKEEIRKARSGLKAKQLASVVRDDVVENWEEKQLDVMKRGVQAKFMQHIDLKNQLLATQHAEIFFVSSTDNFWGAGKDGKGENHLGRILVELRENLRLNDIKIAVSCTGISFNC